MERPKLKRLCEKSIDLPSREIETAPMIFLTGPRQVGKTFLAREMGKSYFNWDTAEVKKAFVKDPYFFRQSREWVVFDEVHKRHDWKRLMKGYFDSPSRIENFLVTGSGRFEQHQKGGDSLQGRYDLYHLFPLTYDEWVSGSRLSLAEPRDFNAWEPGTAKPPDDADLIALGGFPAPLLGGTRRGLVRWLDQYIERLVNEDVRYFSKATQLDKIGMLARLLPGRLASPISMQSLAEDLECSRETIKSWLRLFELLYLGVSLKPYSRRLERAVKQEKKWYFFQWAFAAAEGGACFENYLAIQLLSVCQYWRDQGYGRYELFYLRDQDKREVDFLIAKDLKPVALVEAKSSAQAWTPALRYYSKKLGVPGFLVYPQGPIRKADDGNGWCLPSSVFLSGMLLR